MLYYLIVAFISLSASVLGVLFSLWAIIAAASTNPHRNFGIDMSSTFLRIGSITFILCSVNIYILFKGYVAYQNKNLPQAKLYFGIGSILLYGVFIFGMYVSNR